MALKIFVYPAIPQSVFSKIATFVPRFSPDLLSFYPVSRVQKWANHSLRIRPSPFLFPLREPDIRLGKSRIPPQPVVYPQAQDL